MLVFNEEREECPSARGQVDPSGTWRCELRAVADEDPAGSEAGFGGGGVRGEDREHRSAMSKLE